MPRAPVCTTCTMYISLTIFLFRSGIAFYLPVCSFIFSPKIIPSKTCICFIYSTVVLYPQVLVARTYHPPFFSNFLFTNLFSIKKNYFFIISSLFPYFNLFVSIFIQSYVNIKLHVSTLYYI